MNFFKRIDVLRRIIAACMLAAMALWSLPSVAQTSPPVFALAKNICSGNFAQIIASGNGQAPANCQLASTVVANTDVYYVITVTNPWAQPQQQINLTDALPAGFTQNGAIVCRDEASPTPNVIALATGSGANSIGILPLAIGATVHCFIQGRFANPTLNTNATRVNTVNADNGGNTPFNMTASVTTNVLPFTPLTTDLSVTKTSSAPINISNGATLVTYTIIIKNNGPIDADVADYFTLQDSLSLPTNGVPLNVEYVSSSCSATVDTNCLVSSGPTFAGASPLFVGPTGQTNFFSWGFGSGQGMIKNGGIITLTITVNVSQVNGIGCTAVLNGNGLVNQAFFTLANQTSAYSEINPLNNTSSVTTGVDTGQTTVDPDCGKGHVRFTKVQISPPQGSVVPWGTPVTYAITIENNSIPKQEITIANGDLQDWITEGINTPPFTRAHVKTNCVTSTDPVLCASLNPGISPDSDYKYKFYGETNRAWINDQKIVLQPTESVTFNTQFIYENSDCETVPNAKLQPIINTARLKYMASAYGSIDVVPQGTVYTAQASATTNMDPRPACSFVVTKRTTSKTPRIHFGTGFSYEVTYTNVGAPRTVGTLLDVVRLTIPNYASNVPYASTWSCQQSGGITGATLMGAINGNATYTTSPAQGSPAANLGSNIYFPTNSTLICKIDITVQRPAPNDRNCTQDVAEFENLALMDVTQPFNSNIAWPPSSTYNPASSSNPIAQKVNWAAVKAQLPACWDATVNKSATVVGLPSTNAPWTYVGGPTISYTITTTNKGQSTLGNLNAPPAEPQWLVEDTFNSPYSNLNALAGTPLCDPTSPWCHSTTPMDPKSKIAIRTLAPLASGKWNLQYVAPFIAGQPITNCAKITPDLGAEGPNYYQNTQPIPQPPCVTIPVVEVTAINVKKTLVDITGANVKIGGPFGMQISCTPYPVPTAQATFNLTTDNTGSSPVHTVFPVARSSACTISEISAPIPAASALSCGGAANVDVVKEYLDPQGVWRAMPAVLTTLNTQSVGNEVTVRNTLKCKTGNLQIAKVVSGPVLPAQYASISQNYTINAACNPAGTPTSLTLNAGTQSASGTVTAATNSKCTITEAPPQLPQNIKDYCVSLGQTAAWDPMTISPASPVTVLAGTTTVTVTNKWKCLSTPSMVHVMKILDPGPGGLQLSGLQFSVRSNCTPTASTPASVTGTSGVGPNGNLIGLIIAPGGSTCQFSEPTMPAFPAAAIAQCGAGSQPVWNTPTFVTSTLVIKVTNSWSCAPGGPLPQLEITKYVSGPVMPATVPQPPVSPSQAYEIIANCSGVSTPTTVILNASGSSPASGSIPVNAGATCSLSEKPPATPTAIANYCNQLYFGNNGNPYVVSWDPPVFSPSANPTIATSGNLVTVTNKWKCVQVASTTTTLVITKKVEQIIIPGLTQPYSASIKTYQVTANCSTVAAPNLSLVTLNASGSTPASGSVTVTAGSTCSLSEAPPTIPGDLTGFCGQIYNGNNGNPWTAAWELPVFTPSANPTMTAGTNAVTVTNKWKCIPPINTTTSATLAINKVVTKPYYPANSAPNAVAQNYQINATCYSSPVTVNASGTASGSNTVSVTPGANCSFSEPTLTIPPNIVTFCVGKGTPTWKPPVFTPANLTVASGTNTVTVTNSWECATPPPTNVTLQVKKIVNGPPQTTIPVPIAPIQSFQIGATCLGSPVAVNAGGATLGGANVGNLTLNANCVFSEATPTVNPTLNSYCASLSGTGVGTATWAAPVFSPPSLILATGVNTATVTNTWGCVLLASTSGTVKFYKKVDGPAGAQSLGALNYSFGAMGATPASVSLTANAVSAGYSAPITAAINASLTVTETLPSLAGNTVATSFCGAGRTAAWNLPTFAKVISTTPYLEQPVTMPITVTAGETRIIVTNSWKCVP
jgi:Domain of unknown function DUF11